MRVIFLIVMSLLLCACSVMDNSAYSSPNFKGWTGKNIDSLVTAWGRPNRITTAFNGNWEYRYSLQNPAVKSIVGQTTTKTFATPNHGAYGVNVPTHELNMAPETTSCEVIVEVNPRNLILSVREQGTFCP